MGPQLLQAGHIIRFYVGGGKPVTFRWWHLAGFTQLKGKGVKYATTRKELFSPPLWELRICIFLFLLGMLILTSCSDVERDMLCGQNAIFLWPHPFLLWANFSVSDSQNGSNVNRTLLVPGCPVPLPPHSLYSAGIWNTLPRSFWRRIHCVIIFVW